MDWFANTDILLVNESMHSRDILESNIRKFRVSGDFSIAEDTIVEPNEISMVKIRLGKSLFPQIDTITPWMFKHLEVSMRSCFAQSWIHMYGEIYKYLRPEHIEELNTTWSTYQMNDPYEYRQRRKMNGAQQFK